jgi:hypothetical protein
MTLRRYFALGIAVAAALTLAACNNGTQAAAGITKVTSETSFGMCAGYCKTTLELTATGAVLEREAWGRGAGANLPKQRLTAPLSAAEWQEIAELAAAAKIEGLPDVIGCPDCADGGAESLGIQGTGRNKTIKFDHGATVKEAQPLIERVRAIRAKMLPQE